MDNTATIEKGFAKMGARVKIRENTREDFSINIQKDKKGDFFDIAIADYMEMQILDAQPKNRHLLLLTRDPEDRTSRAQKPRFLCGHDERDWFTCAVPSGNNVFQAMEALKPTPLRNIESQEGLKRKNAQKRHRKLKSGRKIHRQGEFMFIPEPHFQPPGKLAAILKDEPMRRGNVGKPHMAEYLYRQGGTTVHTSNYDQKARSFGYTEEEYKKLMRENRNAAQAHNWSVMKRDATAYVKGRITHSDHKTLDLGDVWHRVNLNTENRAVGAQRVAFLD